MRKILIELAVLVLALLMFFAVGWYLGGNWTQSNWDRAKLAQIEVDAAANARYRAMESSLNQKIIEAQNAATLRNQKLQVAAASAGAVAVSLRDEIATLRRSLPGLADDAVRQRADAVAAVLADCTDSYAGMAAAADRHASDVKTLMEAWPK
jgi:hypothetical protein